MVIVLETCVRVGKRQMVCVIEDLTVSLFHCVLGVFCCKCQLYIRWPVRGERSEHPYLILSGGACTLEHNHPVQKDAVDEVRRQNKRLDTPTKEACEALTGEC